MALRSRPSPACSIRAVPRHLRHECRRSWTAAAAPGRDAARSDRAACRLRVFRRHRGRCLRLLAPLRDRIRRVVLFGPATGYLWRAWRCRRPTALRLRWVSSRSIARRCDDLVKLPGVTVSDLAHREEHALEVQLPFLQTQLAGFRLVPVVVGRCAKELVAAAMEPIWGGPETLIVVSSDLSHYHPYDEARAIDAATRERHPRRAATLPGDEACGCRRQRVVCSSLGAAVSRSTALDLRNSGDTAGDRQRVVGYGAFVLY